MVGIVVALGVTLSSVALGFQSHLRDPPPAASFDVEYGLDGEENLGVAWINITHRTGDEIDGSKLIVMDSSGNYEEWEDIWLGASSVNATGRAHIDGKNSDCELNPITQGEVYRLIWRSSGGSSHIIKRIEIEEPPTYPPTSHSPGTFTC